ncbi:MAG: hypothetical protein EXS36_04195 [Pedosphaera sp.]|nr:hypothetical protein [Pedosphaera sp.]
MNDPNSASVSSQLYSPFWPLFAFFAALSYLQATYLVADFPQLRELKGARSELENSLTQSRVVSRLIDAVSGELLAMAAQSSEAAKIVAEFKIQLDKPSDPAK